MIAAISSWQLAWPWLLLALPLPWLAARALPPAPSRLGSALRIPFGAELRGIEASAGRAPRSRLHWLALLAWAFLCVAAARPQQLGAAVQPPQSGRDLLLAVDLSGSMAERDMTLGPYRVERLTAVKAVLGDFLERRAGDRVGLLLFGLHAYAVTPLTLDRATVRQQLDDSVVGLAGQETAMGDAIALAVKRLRGQDDGKDGRSDGGSTSESAGPADRPVVILLTDGVNTAGAIAPDKAAKLAQAAGIRVHTIGFGGQDQFLQFFGMNARGRSDLDEATLRAIADTTGGRYFRARDTRELAGIYAELDRIEPVARAGEMQMPKIERYPLPLGLALVFALLGAGLRQRLFPA